MKSTQLAIACLATLATLALTVGCKPSSQPPATETRQATDRQFDQVKQETKEAAQAMNDYAYTQKAEFVANMQVQLTEINRELDQLAAIASKSGGTTSAGAYSLRSAYSWRLPLFQLRTSPKYPTILDITAHCQGSGTSPNYFIPDESYCALLAAAMDVRF